MALPTYDGPPAPGSTAPGSTRPAGPGPTGTGCCAASYPTAGAANAALQALPTSYQGRVTQRLTPCTWCHGWHLAPRRRAAAVLLDTARARAPRRSSHSGAPRRLRPRALDRARS